jgi:hypothetical protein
MTLQETTEYEQQWDDEPYDYAEEERYYLKLETVTCPCGRTATATHHQLLCDKWLLAPISRCPPCAIQQVNREADIQLGRAQMLCDVMDKESPMKYRSEPLFEPECPF